ncbi:hypothetical protein Afil01_29630 [Actinorhabdospora filicis]|uniref:Uncharacterized protein n=1 Tax=Actinorhabdospora filicis TaxID=1785913 RepID=A0A9W6WA24_9ACTN|nr:hypothetical protein [Actinorhabdospora filicis]GLZ78156.1 hypothetical protein Afil01_29630 [Actinorhabdospora filicis]
MTSVHTRERTPYDGIHAPDGHTHECCVACTIKNSTNRSNNTVLWPCPEVKALRRKAGLRE